MERQDSRQEKKQQPEEEEKEPTINYDDFVQGNDSDDDARTQKFQKSRDVQRELIMENNQGCTVVHLKQEQKQMKEEEKVLKEEEFQYPEPPLAKKIEDDPENQSDFFEKREEEKQKKQEQEQKQKEQKQAKDALVQKPALNDVSIVDIRLSTLKSMEEEYEQQTATNNKIQSEKPQAPQASEPSSPPPQKVSQNQSVVAEQKSLSLSNHHHQAIASAPSSKIIQQAESQRVGSIYQNFASYCFKFQQTINNYKQVIKNVSSQLDHKVAFKKNLQAVLLEYFEQYSKCHKNFFDKTFKIPKQEQTNPMNKYANIKQELKRGVIQLHQSRRNMAIDGHKLDSFITNYIIKGIKQAFQKYRDQIHAFNREQINPKEHFSKQQKNLKKHISNIEKICKKSIDGERQKDDIFVQFVSFASQEKKFRKELVKYGRTLIPLRQNYIKSQKNLFIELQKIMNQFKNQQKTLYLKASQYTFVENYIDYIEAKTTFQELCTITDVDFIRAVLQLQNKKDKIEVTNKHFEQFIEMQFFENIVGVSEKLLKIAYTKTFPTSKSEIVWVHTISQNLVEFDKKKKESLQKIEVKNLNARIFAEGGIECDIITGGFFFKYKKTVKIQLKDNDYAQELISYLNQMQEIKGKGGQK